MIQQPERQLLRHGKCIPFGLYDDLIAEPKTIFWDDEGFPMKRRRTQRKTWIFFGVYAPDFFAGVAIVDAGMISTAFAYLSVPSKGIFVEDKLTLPLGFPSAFDPSLTDEWKLGKYRIVSQDDRMILSMKGKFDLQINATHNHKGVSIVAPSVNRPFNFTYKNLPMHVEAKLSYKGQTFQANGAYGAIDFTKGYPPRETRWNWASFIGETEKNLSLACNLVDRFNANMENVLWLGEQRIVLSEATFTPGNPMDKGLWKIMTKDGVLDMQFEPSGARSENLNVGVMKSIFTQPFGVYRGTVMVNGEKQAFEARGVAEDHFAVW